MRRAALRSLLLACALAAAASEARADVKQDCIAASERGQRARIDGKLPDARTELAQCSRNECPGVIRQDCNEWLSEVTKLMPTIVIGVRDPKGKDLVDARITLDGNALAAGLDGKGIPVPTGTHTLRVEHEGFKPSETRILLREGEKARQIDVRMEALDGGARTAPRKEPDVDHSIAPWIVTGVGGAALVTGGIIAYLGFAAIPANCSYSSTSCTPIPGKEAETTQSVADAKSATTLAYAGLGTLGGGAALVIGGLVWHFLEPTSKREGLVLVPIVDGRGVGGVGATGRF